MVVLKPILEGEFFRSCSRCPHIGICSPIRERTSFGRNGSGYKCYCRRCAVRLFKERMEDPSRAETRRASRRARYAEMSKEEKAALEAKNRAGRERRRRDDPEKIRKQAREANRRYRARIMKDPERASAWRENGRIDAALRAERAGKKRKPRRVNVIDGTAPRVRAETFRLLLEMYRSARQLSPEGLANELGLVPGRVRSVLGGEYEQVAVDVVSRALARMEVVVSLDGRPIINIDDLYGEERING